MCATVDSYHSNGLQRSAFEQMHCVVVIWTDRSVKSFFAVAAIAARGYRGSVRMDRFNNA